MFNNSGVLAVILSLKLLLVTQTEAWYLGVGHLPACAYNCLNRVMSEQYSCQDLKCFCQTPNLLTSSEACFRKECDFNSLSRAFKLMATCQESYGSTAPPPSPSPSPVPNPATPPVAYPNPYLAPGSATNGVSAPNVPGSQPNGGSTVLPPQPQPGSPSVPIKQTPAGQPQGAWAGTPYGSQPQPYWSPYGSQPQAPTTGSSSVPQAQVPAGGQTIGTENGSQQQPAPIKGGSDNSTTTSTPQTKTVTPLFLSSANSSANPSSGPPFASGARGLFGNRDVFLIFSAVVLSFLV